MKSQSPNSPSPKSQPRPAKPQSAARTGSPGATDGSGGPSTAEGPGAAGAETPWTTAEPPGWRYVGRRFARLPATLIAHQDLIRSSVRRELEARFSGTVLGWAWPLVFPVFTFVVYYFIFAELLALKFGDDLPPEMRAAMGVYMFTGIVVWAGFSEGLVRATNVIVDNGNLIKKLAFPTEILPLNMVLVSLTTMLFGVGAFLLAVFVSPLFTAHGLWVLPGPKLLWIPVLVVLQGLFTYGLGLLLATMQVFVRDTAQLVSLLMTVWMFLTPLFWAPAIVPDVAPYIDALRGNPLYHLVYAWRSVLMSDVPVQAFPAGDSFGHSLTVFGVWAVAAFLVGFLFFIFSQRRFADEV
jgi:lipopolysaccharide transport system permease protein